MREDEACTADTRSVVAEVSTRGSGWTVTFWALVFLLGLAVGLRGLVF